MGKHDLAYRAGKLISGLYERNKPAGHEAENEEDVEIVGEYPEADQADWDELERVVQNMLALIPNDAKLIDGETPTQRTALPLRTVDAS